MKLEQFTSRLIYHLRETLPFLERHTYYHGRRAGTLLAEFLHYQGKQPSDLDRVSRVLYDGEKARWGIYGQPLAALAVCLSEISYAIEDDQGDIYPELLHDLVVTVSRLRRYWRGPIAVLDTPAPDYRMLAAPHNGQVQHAGLPLPFLEYCSDRPALLIGTVTGIWVEGNLLMANGTFDTRGNAGRSASSKVASATKCGTSIRVTDASHALRGKFDVASGWRIINVLLTDQPLFPKLKIEVLSDF